MQLDYINSLPDKCVIFFKMNFNSTNLNYLSKNKNLNFYFDNKNSFIVFKDISVAENFLKVAKDSKLVDISIIPAYVKINGMFITFKNFYNMILNYKKNDLEGRISQYFDNSANSFFSSYGNILDVSSIITNKINSNKDGHI